MAKDLEAALPFYKALMLGFGSGAQRFWVQAPDLKVLPQYDISKGIAQPHHGNPQQRLCVKASNPFIARPGALNPRDPTSIEPRIVEIAKVALKPNNLYPCRHHAGCRFWASGLKLSGREGLAV